MAEKIKLYKVTQKIGTASIVRFMTQEAINVVAQQLFFVGDEQKNIVIETIPVDATVMNLQDFFQAGGILVGTVDPK